MNLIADSGISSIEENISLLANYLLTRSNQSRAVVREFVEKEIAPYVHQWDEAKAVPKDLFAKCAEAGWLPAVVGAPWPTKYPSLVLISSPAIMRLIVIVIVVLPLCACICLQFSHFYYTVILKCSNCIKFI
jgi:alkylation response protein AidB-like acyl-CoA dehydrogenase